MIYHNEKIAQRLKEERKRAGLSQDELARKINYSKPTIINWERKNGKNAIPHLEQILSLCEIYDCEAAYLLGEIDTRTHINANIQNEIGLTEEAIDVLKEYKHKSESRAVAAANNDFIQYAKLFDHNNVLEFDYKTALDNDLQKYVDFETLTPAFISFILTHSDKDTGENKFNLLLKELSKQFVILINYYCMDDKIRKVCEQAYHEAVKKIDDNLIDYLYYLRNAYTHELRDIITDLTFSDPLEQTTFFHTANDSFNIIHKVLSPGEQRQNDYFNSLYIHSLIEDFRQEIERTIKESDKELNK